MALKKSYAVRVLAFLCALLVMLCPLDARAVVLHDTVSGGDVPYYGYVEYPEDVLFTYPEIMLFSAASYTSEYEIYRYNAGTGSSYLYSSGDYTLGTVIESQNTVSVQFVFSDLANYITGPGLIRIDYSWEFEMYTAQYPLLLRIKSLDGTVIDHFEYTNDEGLGYYEYYYDGSSDIHEIEVEFMTGNASGALICRVSSLEFTPDPEAEEPSDTKNILELLRDFFGGFFDNLGEKIKGWFVPTAEELTAFLDEVNAWFSERLGFIWYPFSLALDLVSALAGGSPDQNFVVPALQLNILGENYTIWNELTADLDAFGIFVYVRIFTGFLLVSGVIKLAIDKWDEWIGGHGTG